MQPPITLDFKTLQPVEIDSAPISLESESDRSAKQSPRLRIKTWLLIMHKKNNSIAMVALTVYWLLQMMRFRMKWSRQVRSLSCKVAFIWGDNAGTTNGELLNLLKKSGSVLVHLPVALSDQNIIAQLRFHSNVYRIPLDQPLVSRLLHRCFPEQALTYKGRKVFYYHPSEAWAMALLGILPRKPWILGSSLADYVLLADDAQRTYWTDRGLSARKVRVIGNLDMQEILQSEACLKKSNSRFLNQQKRLVLINMPNLVEHSIFTDWRQFWVEVDKILRPYMHENLLLVVSLHPKCDRRNYAWLEKKYACIVVQEEIGGWISLADLYISACSTTELIAGELEVPVVDIGAIFLFESEVLRLIPTINFVSNYGDYEDEAKKFLANYHERPKRFRSSGQRSGVQTDKPYQNLERLLRTEILVNQ